MSMARARPSWDIVRHHLTRSRDATVCRRHAHAGHGDHAVSGFRPQTRSVPGQFNSKMGFMRDFTTSSASRTRSTGSSPEDQDRMNKRKLREISRDFRTDTVTIPTDEMLQVALRASRGDDVYGEDQATNELQEKLARLTGKEAALFCVSGTMTNQLGIRSHLTQPPHSIILDSRSHVHLWEGGGVAMHSQASSHALFPENGHHLTLEDIMDSVITGEDIHTAPTKLVSLENTLSGMVFPQDEIVRISNAMHELGIIMHCDGARLWETHAKTGMSIEELCRPFDSVSLCLSKGIGAPVGSVLVGSKKLIDKARWFRKMFGGGIRQSGGLAAAANYALEQHLPLLPGCHDLAQKLARALTDLGVRLLLPVETNMLWIDSTPLGFSLDDLANRARQRDITLGAARMVIHHQISPQAVDDLIALVGELKREHESKSDGEENAPLSDKEVARNRERSEGKWDLGIEPPSKRRAVKSSIYGNK